MAVNTLEKKYFGDHKVLVVTYHGEVDVHDLAHGASMVSLYVETCETAPLVFVDVSGIDDRHVSIISLIMTRCDAILKHNENAKMLMLSGEGRAQEYIDEFRKDHRVKIAVVPRMQQARMMMQLLINMQHRRVEFQNKRKTRTMRRVASTA